MLNNGRYRLGGRCQIMSIQIAFWCFVGRDPINIFSKNVLAVCGC